MTDQNICVCMHFHRYFLMFSVSKPAPHFEGTAVVNGNFEELKLSDYKGKYLVLLFYPMDL